MPPRCSGRGQQDPLGRERLARYGARPGFALGRLSELDDGPDRGSLSRNLAAHCQAGNSAARRSFPHLRVRRRGPVLTIESGKKPNVVAHARLRRDTVHLWILEMPTASEKWEVTPHRDNMDRQVQLLVTDLAWPLAPR